MRNELQPQLRWVAVVGCDGHRHMEMRWHVPVVSVARAA
jgi:hypothetical protein